ncbi:low-specificity L-threonine aldolase [Pseudazoarcus pumilus]|nr:low-specificity L-threonine aldolase [Pseudazoarcus pumilus]
MTKTMDFRSDTVTQPSPEMKRAMIDAPLGDDVLGDDPTVNRLQEMAADMLGFEAALFAPSGTQTNTIAMMCHCARGDEAIVGQQWHTYRMETGGMAVLGSIQPQPLENRADGTIDLADIEGTIKIDDPHFARTRLVVLENTTGGKVLPPAYMREVLALAERHRLKTHIDGARLFNAAMDRVERDGGQPFDRANEICQGWDSLSLCLSKGLGAPVGSLVLGNQEFIRQAKRVRKMLGGAMRQAGMLAAAGIYALENNVVRMSEDHDNARHLARGLREAVAANDKLAGRIEVPDASTNILFIDVDPELAPKFLAHLSRHKVRVSGGPYQSSSKKVQRLRWITHLDVDREDVERAVEIVAAF